jgi:serine/threonine-protein kinase HipA
MRSACVYVHGIQAGILQEQDDMKYEFTYATDYAGAPVSLTMPVVQKIHTFNKFPPFFEGLLPEGILLEALLRNYKLDKHDYFGQLLLVGADVIGAVSIEELQ